MHARHLVAQVTDIDGQPLDFSHGRTLARNRGVVATNARIHGEVLAAVREVLEGGKASTL